MKPGSHYFDKYKHLYMEMAEAHAKCSKANKLKVGCVIVLNDLAVFGGINGMPSASDSEICEDTSIAQIVPSHEIDKI